MTAPAPSRPSRALPAALALAAAAALAGCTAGLDLSGREWTRPDTGVSQVTWDEIECVRAASAAGRTPDLIVGGVVDAVRNALRESGRAAAYGRCMVGKGYQRALAG